MRALVVEDDRSVAGLNARLLEREGFKVEVAGTASQATRLAGTNAYDLILLDMTLPDGNGMGVLEIIRERSRTTPVLIVSGAEDIHETVAALDAGADDYLHKPYEPDELSARVRALMRRSQVDEEPIVKCGNLTLHRLLRDATVGEKKLNLTAKEFVLLEYFVVNRGKTLTRKELLERVWRFDFDPGTNMVDVNVSRLRAKLTGVAATCRLDSERGVGYVMALN